MNRRLITIITVAFNAEEYIHECARSILNQTYTNIQWLVLDNGCTDKTGQYLSQYALSDKRVKLIKNIENYLYSFQYFFYKYFHIILLLYIFFINIFRYFYYYIYFVDISKQKYPN